jgi:hypothetical protein
LDEDQNWLYCKDTNTKLFPVSIHTLAKTFISGADYLRKLDELCNSVGIMSDDGDAIVDKHSGFVMRKIDFSAEEGFDESGFRITTHDIIEKDLGEVLMEQNKKKEKRVFENEVAEVIFNVANTVCRNIDIPIDSIEDLKHEVVTFLLEKLHLYNQDKGKAYSYFGTITKRYLILKNKKNYQKLQDKGDLIEVDDDKTIREEIVNEYYGGDYSVSEFMKLYIKYIDKNLTRLFPKDVDAQTADAIVELFRKCESLDIFNKKALYIYIREIVDVDTPQITKIIKKLKVTYVELYNQYYSSGYVRV